jgi:uncharacterized protein YdeI (YjbR/CyaY-like superfamily)
MAEKAEYLEFSDRHEWRAWLEANHARAEEAWLVHYKKGFQKGTLTLGEAVEEALSYGWIDSTLRRIDERRYALRYSPRRRNSIWSESNKRRVQRLMRQGRLAPAGLAAVAEAKRSGQWEAATRREQVDIVPPELEEALRVREGALNAYLALPASRRKQFIHWITSAKRPATKQRRIEAILDEVVGQSAGESGG